MKFCGRDFWLEVVAGDGGWHRLAGARVDGGAFQKEAVDVSNKTDGHWRQLLEGCGIKHVRISSGGVVESPEPVLDALQNAFESSMPVQARLVSGGVAVVHEGLYEIESFGRSGEHGGAEVYELVLVSSGEVAAPYLPPFLDLYPGADIAWSTDKMSAAYAGPCLRARRSSDNAEQDVGFGLDGRLDEAALLAFVGAGDGYVTVWYDQSGNGYNMLQAAAANQPRIVKAGVARKNPEGNSIGLEVRAADLSVTWRMAWAAPFTYTHPASRTYVCAGSQTYADANAARGQLTTHTDMQSYSTLAGHMSHSVPFGPGPGINQVKYGSTANPPEWRGLTPPGRTNITSYAIGGTGEAFYAGAGVSKHAWAWDGAVQHQQVLGLPYGAQFYDCGNTGTIGKSPTTAAATLTGLTHMLVVYKKDWPAHAAVHQAMTLLAHLRHGGAP